jgi:hypothetical protein
MTPHPIEKTPALEDDEQKGSTAQSYRLINCSNTNASQETQ